MIKQHRVRWFQIGIVVLTGLIFLLAWRWNTTAIKQTKGPILTSMEPVILVPGSSATINRFDDVLKQLNTRGNRHSVIKTEVSRTGQLTTTGKLRRGDKHPYLIIGFQNNQDGYPTILKQADWFNKAFKALANRYNFNNFVALGHSNGGLVLTFFLEKYYNAANFRIHRLMTIGTPFNLETSSETTTPLLKDLMTHREKIPQGLTVLSVRGSQNYYNDGIVPLNSVEAGKYIFQNQVDRYTVLTVTGKNTEHSDLLGNSQVNAMIENQLLPSYKVPNNQLVNQGQH